MSDEIYLAEPEPGSSLGHRFAVLTLSVPSLLLWGAIAAFAAMALIHIIGAVPSGLRPGNGGRALYLFIMCGLALGGSGAALWATRRAYQGRAPLWWVAAVLVAGAATIVTLGSMGD